MRGFSLEKSWRASGVANTDYYSSGNFAVPFGKQFTQITGRGEPGYDPTYIPGTFQYYYVTAFYSAPSEPDVFATGTQSDCPPTSYYTTPGASTTWSCDAVYSPDQYYPGEPGATQVILGVTFPGGVASSQAPLVSPTLIDTNYTYVYPNSYSIPNLRGGYVTISVR